jgi:hypothetical protein
MMSFLLSFKTKLGLSKVLQCFSYMCPNNPYSNIYIIQNILISKETKVERKNIYYCFERKIYLKEKICSSIPKMKVIRMDKIKCLHLKSFVELIFLK